jgi:hypothetical protein
MVLALLAVGLGEWIQTANAQEQQWVTWSSSWRYNKSGANLGTAWTAPAYNDTVAGWEGPGMPLFGFETSPNVYAPLTFPAASAFPDPTTQSPFITNYYFRTHFTATSTGPTTMLITTNAVDDGSVVYLNGVEIFRANMPAGAITATTFASTAPAEGWPPAGATVFIRTNLATNVVVGDNVLAVEVHQSAVGSSDEVFGMTLTAVPPSQIAITSQPVGQTNTVGSTVTLSVGVTGSSPVYQWYSNNVKIASATTANYNVPTAQTNSGVNYFVVVTNTINSVTSSVARVLILPVGKDITPIKLISAGALPPYTPNSNRLVVTFDKALLRPIDGGTAVTNPDNYHVSIFGTTNIIPVSNITFGAGSVLALNAAANFKFGTNYVLCVDNVAGTNRLPILPGSCVGVSIVTSNPPPPTTALLPFGSPSWFYTEADHNIGTNWRGTNYIECTASQCVPPYDADGAWAAGQTIFYYEFGTATPCPGSSLIGGPLDVGYITYYFRSRFVAPTNVTSTGLLYVTNYFDDGAVFYLNGKELFRTNVPAGELGFNTPGTSRGPVCSTVSISVTNLLTGPRTTNVLAAELHESGGGTDFAIYFGAALGFATNFSVFVTNTSPVPPKLLISQPSPTTSVVSWNTNVGGLKWGLESKSDLSPGSWTPLPNGSPYTNTSTGQKLFRAHKQ